MQRVDARSLALHRACMSAIVLSDVLRPFLVSPLDAVAFFTDDGLLDADDTPHHATLHRLVFHRGSIELQQALALLHVAAALALLLGWHTRVAAWSTFALTAMQHGRNELIRDCGDRLLRSQLLWLALAPCGRRFSLDARRAAAQLRHRKAAQVNAKPGMPTTSSTDVAWCASAGFYLQQLALYWATLMFRRRGTMWYESFSAVHYSLHLPSFARPLAYVLREWPELSFMTNVAVVSVEAVGPLLLALLPLHRLQRVRLGILATMAAMQLGFGLSLRLEIFPWVSLLSLTALLPPIVWESAPTRPSTPPTSSRAMNVVRVFFLCYVALLNLGDVGLVPKLDNGDIGESLRINQYWVMFSPDVPTLDGRLQIDGHLEGDDTHAVDLMHAIRTEFEPSLMQYAQDAAPTVPAYDFKTFRWQKLLREAVRQRKDRLPRIARFICRQWRHPRQRLDAVTITWHEYRSPPPHYTHPWFVHLSQEQSRRPGQWQAQRIGKWKCQ